MKIFSAAFYAIVPALLSLQGIVAEDPIELGEWKFKPMFRSSF